MNRNTGIQRAVSDVKISSSVKNYRMFRKFIYRKIAHVG